MILNAALSLFFHITTGEIRQFVPRPKGFVRRITAQAMYYLRGIFTGAAHPLAKSAKHKLNPLQQVTYVGLLNVLFPLQVLTGALLWIGGVAPQVLEPIGGLSIIGPVHNVGSWLFLTFIVVHVYLTTTGHTPGALIKAMVSGWEMLEEEAE
jgi:thiosulfate reductase cytochrome b subunit